MPDMSPADLAAVAGTFLAAVITGLGMRRGDAEKRGLPAADQSLSAGVFLGLDAETLHAILDALRDLHADLASWRSRPRSSDCLWRAGIEVGALTRYCSGEPTAASVSTAPS